MKPFFGQCKKTGMLFAALVLFAVCMPAAVLADTADTDTTDVTVTLTAGVLSMEAAPDLDFGTNAITGSDLQLPTATDGVITVSDLRGNGAGWGLTVALSPFTSGANTNSLPNANITVANPTVTGAVATNKPTVQASNTLTCDNVAVQVMAAANGNGMGVWDSTWLSGNAKLNIPMLSAIAGTHGAVLSWTLADAP